MNVKILYFRSLYSQSISSVSIAKFSKYLLDRGYNTHILLLSNTDYGQNIKTINLLNKEDLIIYKTNFKDFNYGIELLKNIASKLNKKIILVGPFAVLNKAKILKNYNFIRDILDIQSLCKLDNSFPIIGDKIYKDTIISDYDREIESKEQGYYVNIESSTGCINHCAFCHINLTKQPFANRNISDVVNEMKELYDKYNKRYFIFNDSMFYKGTNDIDRINHFCDLIKKSNMQIFLYIYLAIIPKIPEELLIKLKEVGLIRVFFGIESISDEFQIHNKKNVSSKLANDFIGYLKKYQISYHIGYMLFYPDITYSGLLTNITYLYSIQKLFRLGVLVEKMRILPNSDNKDILYVNKNQVDQAYNYHFKDKEVENAYNLINEYFSHINIRMLEQYLTGYDTALTMLKHKKKINDFLKEETVFYENVKNSNDLIYKILIDIINNKKFTQEQVDELKVFQVKLEVDYEFFMNKLNHYDFEIFNSIPLGKEDLNL